jgi:hypothetical protein
VAVDEELDDSSFVHNDDDDNENEGEEKDEESIDDENELDSDVEFIPDEPERDGSVAVVDDIENYPDNDHPSDDFTGHRAEALNLIHQNDREIPLSYPDTSLHFW